MWLTGCDDLSSSSSDTRSTPLQSLSIEPSTFTFGDEASLADTTVTIALEATTESTSPAGLLYSLERRGEQVTAGELSPQNETTFQATMDITVNTGQNSNYTVYVYEAESSGGERLQGGIRFRGRNISPPVVEEAFNTEEVSIPDSGNERIDFFARVVHPNGQELIDRVRFFLIDQGGNQLGDDFEMFDDGVFSGQQGFIDEAAGDSLYSRAFFINEDNSPDNVSVFYYATGVDGQSSDTLQTELRITE